MHHGALEGQIFAFPVKALARQVAHIWVHTYDGIKLCCEYWESVGRSDIIDKDMSIQIKIASETLVYPIRNM